jgi:hypothetical protein
MIVGGPLVCCVCYLVFDFYLTGSSILRVVFPIWWEGELQLYTINTTGCALWNLKRSVAVVLVSQGFQNKHSVFILSLRTCRITGLYGQHPFARQVVYWTCHLTDFDFICYLWWSITCHILNSLLNCAIWLSGCNLIKRSLFIMMFKHL